MSSKPNSSAKQGPRARASRAKIAAGRARNCITTIGDFLVASRVETNIRPRQFCKSLLAWYDLHHRDLPWRASRDPYRVWLSEIMLQQTRVAAVIAHYNEFLRRFPTVEKLAKAREASVLAA